jgi:cytochrome c oxidase assembly factor CtaG
VSAYRFSWEPAFLVLAGIAAVLYAWAARRDPPSGRRITVFALGLIIVATSLNSPLETIASKRLLLIHLLQNALIADLAPPLILLGLTPNMRAKLNELGLYKLRARYALPAWLVAWYGTHIAGFYDWALRTGWALNIEHAVLIVGGLLFWWPLVSGRLSAPPALAYLGAGFVASSFLGLAFIFASRPVYPFYKDAPRLWGLSPVRDQNLGGILMNSEQTLIFLVAIGWYISQLLKDDSPEPTFQR